MHFVAIVIGVSSGGMNAMKVMFSLLPKDFNTPIIIVQHISARSDNQWIKLLNEKSNLYIKEADEKEKIENGKVYIAPPNYHLLIEKDRTFSLTIDERVNFARPSIDVLFESAAEAYKKSISLKPDFFDPNFNIGALYVNKAVYYDDKAKNLPLDAEAEFNKLKAEADKYLAAAIPYLEKAAELQPTDLATLNSLKQIYIRQQKSDKIKAINEKISALPKK